MTQQKRAYSVQQQPPSLTLAGFNWRLTKQAAAPTNFPPKLVENVPEEIPAPFDDNPDGPATNASDLPVPAGVIQSRPTPSDLPPGPPERPEAPADLPGGSAPPPSTPWYRNPNVQWGAGLGAGGLGLGALMYYLMNRPKRKKEASALDTRNYVRELARQVVSLRS